jgi:hypothetical protein
MPTGFAAELLSNANNLKTDEWSGSYKPLAHPGAKLADPSELISRQVEVDKRIEILHVQLWQIQAEFALDVLSVRRERKGTQPGPAPTPDFRYTQRRVNGQFRHETTADFRLDYQVGRRINR